MKSITKIIIAMCIAAVAIAGIAIVIVRYMDVIQRQVELFRDLIARRRHGVANLDEMDDFEEGDEEHFESFETPDESIPDLSF